MHHNRFLELSAGLPWAFRFIFPNSCALFRIYLPIKFLTMFITKATWTRPNVLIVLKLIQIAIIFLVYERIEIIQIVILSWHYSLTTSFILINSLVGILAHTKWSSKIDSIIQLTPLTNFWRSSSEKFNATSFQPLPSHLLCLTRANSHLITSLLLPFRAAPQTPLIGLSCR